MSSSYYQSVYESQTSMCRTQDIFISVHTGGADSASGGSGGSGMECIQLRSPPGPFHYLISEQAKSLVALQNEVGALLEFRDLVIETFPNLRSKMAPSTPASGTRRDWEPGVRVRRKLAGGSGDTTRTKPQPSVQDSGFSTETSCGKDAHSSSASASASASRTRPLEDELWPLLDVIQRKGVRLRDEAELLRGELDERHSGDTAEESFARALSGECGECGDLQRLRCERDALLARAAQLEAEAAASPPAAALATSSPLGRLDSALDTPSRAPRVATPDSKKFAAILLESNPVELQRQLLTSTVQNQVLLERLKRAAARRSLLLERLERARDLNEDLKFRLEEKNIELEGARARVRQLEGKQRSASESLERSRDAHSSMRDMEPLHIPEAADDDCDTPRRPPARPSRIPLHTAHKGAAPRPPPAAAAAAAAAAGAAPPRPPSAHSAHSVRSARSAASARSRSSTSAPKSAVPVRRSPPHDNKKSGQAQCRGDPHSDPRAPLVAEYVARTERLAPLFSRLHTHAVRSRPLPADLLLDYQLAYETPQNLALELTKSILYENADSIDKTLKSINSHGEDSLWNGKPQQYFESMNYGEVLSTDNDLDVKDYDSDSLAP
ncbi:nucleolar and coiled-body phosphoprotein 1 isoform X2 [Galleria mellonella]|uniref:Nucleolar and coiled-body phosphoprotein 1 isoform X2 n=1 Tax=Galleria mellonella TaxID=7137 RepID=A0A6J3BVP4_GALME|nr:nucleolar and coiled-body phosphoprotein 1 isoform X2 [Galleria mellonella]